MHFCVSLGDRFRLMYTVVHELDIMRSFAAYQEADLSKGYKSALVSAEPVGEQIANDTIWHCKSASEQHAATEIEIVVSLLGTTGRKDMQSLGYYVPRKDIQSLGYCLVD
eukprot:4057667-Amphidinium_carterae.1